jgi:hypothetical protein
MSLFPVCAACLSPWLLSTITLHEVRAPSKAPSIPVSLYFSHVFIAHKAMVKRIRRSGQPCVMEDRPSQILDLAFLSATFSTGAAVASIPCPRSEEGV